MARDSYLQELCGDWLTYSHLIATCQVQVSISWVIGDNVSHSTIFNMEEEEPEQW